MIVAISLSVNAQPGKVLNSQFMKIMLAFPKNFTTISKGNYDSLWETYESNVMIEGTYGMHVVRKHKTTNRYLRSYINIDDDASLADFKKNFSDWVKKIEALDFNGAKLKDIQDTRYSKNTNWYIMGKAWQIDNSAGNIAPEYRGFTIRLELLNLDEGGWQMELIIGDLNAGK